jgi:hypothetical protein
MADLVKYAAASAIPQHKRFIRQGMATRAAGSVGKKSIIDGYIAITSVNGGDSLTKVIDLPAQILWVSRNTFDVGATWYFAAAGTIGDRDMYIPAATITRAPVAVTADNAMLVTPNVYQFVAPDYGVTTNGGGKAYVHGLPDVYGEWVYGITHTRVDIDGEDPVVLEDFVMTVYGVRWGAALRRLDANNAMVLPPAGVDPADLLPSTKTRVLCVPAVSIAVAAGKPDVVIRQLPNNVFLASVQVRETLVADEPPIVGVYTAVGGRNQSGATRADEPVIVVGKVTLADTVEQSMAWGSAPSVAVGYAGSSVLNVLESIGLHVGADVTTCVAVHHASTGYYQTMIHRLDVDTGAVLGASTFSLYPDLAQPICSSRDALWVAKGSTTSNVSTGCDLYRVVDGVPTLMNTGGWMPVSTLITGIAASANLWILGAMAPTIVELGEDRVGVIACAAGTYSPTAAVDWYLVELEISTNTLVGVRGLFGVMSVTQLTTNNPRPLAITVVTPQALNEAGVVTTPAVLLKNVFLSTSVSTDGGFTWREVATGARGYPYYFGNRAHPFTPGESL